MTLSIICNTIRSHRIMYIVLPSRPHLLQGSPPPVGERPTGLHSGHSCLSPDKHAYNFNQKNVTFALVQESKASNTFTLPMAFKTSSTAVLLLLTNALLDDCPIAQTMLGLLRPKHIRAVKCPVRDEGFHVAE